VTLSQKTVAGALNNEKKEKEKRSPQSVLSVNHSNDDENSAVFSSRQNSCNDDAARIEDGKPFQARAATTGEGMGRG